MGTETRIDDLINRWEQMRERGTPQTIEELCSHCPDLVAEVRHRIRALREVDSALDIEAQDLQPRPEDRVREGAEIARGLPQVVRATAVYRQQDHHDHGGLGIVFTAYQEELDRTVALKRIRPDRLHAAARRRFLREAALTARLQHPGIVPIYGLGQDDSGPFYTMAFIQGQTLQEAIEQFHKDQSLRRDPGLRSLAFRGLLQQFVATCDTVAYAHDQGVVHRDLKPTNILLGPYGQTLVMDWGLAKRLGGDDAAADAEGDAPAMSPSSEGMTVTGEIMGTPQYMSPEQARGEPAGPAGDIFCLGLILYAMLTGKPAFEESSSRDADRLKAVRDAAVVPPRGRDPKLPRALEAICLKALAARPEDRYARAQALAEDVTRWLGDEPVTAWREPFWRRARRWARRNRAVVTGAVAALLAGLISLAAVAVVQARAHARLNTAYSLLKTANDATKRALAEKTKAQDATAEALADTRAAKKATDAALVQSEESRKQAEAVSTFLVEAFRSPDPSRDGREVKVADVLDRASDRLDKQFAGSKATKGALLYALGRTYFGLGLYDRAAILHSKARADREAALGPDHPDTLTSCSDLAAAYVRAGRTAEAIPLFQATLGLREAKLGLDHPDTLTSRSDLAVAYLRAGRVAEAIPQLEATLRLREAKLGPDHSATLMSRNNLALAYWHAGRTSEAIALHVVTLRLRQAKLGPDHPQTLMSRNNLAIAYAVAGRRAEAIALFEETLRLQEAKLGPDHPDTLKSRNNLANAYYETGRLAEAIVVHEGTLRLREAKLAPDHPDTLNSRSSLASAYGDAGRTAEAIALEESTLRLRDAKLGPDHPDALMSRNNLASAYDSIGRGAEAEGLYRDVLARRRKAVEPDSPLLAGDLAALGGYLLQQSRWSEAEPLLREAVAIHVKATPDDWKRYDAMSLLGEALVGQGRYAEAEPPVVAGYEGMKARESRIAVPAGSRLRAAATRVVHLYEGWGQPEKAAAWKAKLRMADLPAQVFARP
jgi:eukaryotic-like serine/threonine-protein kinase